MFSSVQTESGYSFISASARCRVSVTGFGSLQDIKAARISSRNMQCFPFISSLLWFKKNVKAFDSKHDRVLKKRGHLFLKDGHVFKKDGHPSSSLLRGGRGGVRVDVGLFIGCMMYHHTVEIVTQTVKCR